MLDASTQDTRRIVYCPIFLIKYNLMYDIWLLSRVPNNRPLQKQKQKQKQKIPTENGFSLAPNSRNRKIWLNENQNSSNEKIRILITFNWKVRLKIFKCSYFQINWSASINFKKFLNFNG